MAVKTFGADVVNVWARGYASEGRNRSNETIFFNGDVIYSYGTHFPMAMRMNDDSGTWYLINADTYSSTTSNHQSQVREALRGEPQLLIPFSSLENAGIDPRSDTSQIRRVDSEPDKRIPVARTDKDTGEPYIGYLHLMGSSLFTAQGYREVERFPRDFLYELTYEQRHKTPGVKYDWNWSPEGTYTSMQILETSYFLAGLDETGRDPHNSFFLAQLDIDKDNPPTTVDEAYEALKPYDVIHAECRGLEVKRQGEFFFIPVTDAEQKQLNYIAKEGKKVLKETPLADHAQLAEAITYANGALLPNKDPEREQRHKVTARIQTSGHLYARGTCRHTGGDHKMLKLPEWYQVVENVQLGSWVSAGKVD